MVSLRFTTKTAGDRIRQPEYTGENHCTPCTAANIAITGAGSTLIAKLTSRRLGSTTFLTSLIVIYLRGYLVPGTPTLTKRYFPDWVLRSFDKDSPTQLTDAHTDIDPERVLLDAGIVEPCRGEIDLCLTADFRETWRERIHTVRTHNPDDDDLSAALNVSVNNDQLRIEQPGSAFVASTKDGVIGQWSSQAAVIADVAAAPELSERLSNWSDFDPADISRVLRSLRIFAETCPDCDGSVQLEEEVIESCCRSYDVVAAVCQDCDARLFELEWDEPVMDDADYTQESHMIS